jgi:hypothetical protein
MTSNPLKLNEEAQAFSYTPAELFNTIMCIVAHPHKTLTEHDKSRAMAIFVTFADYLGNYTQSDNNFGHCIYESDATDFEGYVLELLGKAGLPDFNRVDVDNLLK